MWLPLLLLLLIVAEATVTPAPLVDPATLIADCGDGIYFSRAQGISCILDAIDGNHDGQVTKEEITDAKSTYLHWWESGILKLFGLASVDQIMNDCDENKDGVITYQDMYRSQSTCLPIKDQQGKVTGALCKLKEYICDRASEHLGHPVYR